MTDKNRVVLLELRRKAWLALSQTSSSGERWRVASIIARINSLG